MKHSVKELAKKIYDSLPESMRDAQNDLESHLHKVLQAGFNKLDLVTREEFDAQVAVLQRTRHKLERLEKQLHELEKHKK